MRRPILTAALALFTASFAFAAQFPLTIDQVTTGPKGHVRLTNTGTQPVTAWSVAVVTQPAAGQTHREVGTSDGYLSEVTGGIPGSSRQLERFMPGESRQIEFEMIPPDASVEVAAVVLDDGTAIGEEPLINAIFERRVKEREARRAVTEIFADTLPNLTAPNALDELRNRLQALVQRDASVPCRAALDAVESYRARGGSENPEEIRQALQRYAAFVTSEYELAKKHSMRKNPAKD